MIQIFTFFLASYLGNLSNVQRPPNGRQYMGPRANLLRQSQSLQQQQQQQIAQQRQQQLFLQQDRYRRIEPHPNANMNESRPQYPNGMGPQMATHRRLSVDRPPPPSYFNASPNINFYNSANQNAVNAAPVAASAPVTHQNTMNAAPVVGSAPVTHQNTVNAAQVAARAQMANQNTVNAIPASAQAANQSNQRFLPSNWVYNASSGQANPIPQVASQQGSQAATTVNQNGFRIRSVTEINTNLHTGPTLNGNIRNPNRNSSPIYNAPPARDPSLHIGPPPPLPPSQLLQRQVPQIELNRPNDNNHTPPSPPYTPSLDDSIEVKMKRYGDQIQIFTCPKTGSKENLQDIIEHSGETRRIVQQCILHEDFVAAARQAVHDERQKGCSTNQLRNQIVRFFNMQVPPEYAFLMNDDR